MKNYLKSMLIVALITPGLAMAQGGGALKKKGVKKSASVVMAPTDALSAAFDGARKAFDAKDNATSSKSITMGSELIAGQAKAAAGKGAGLSASAKNLSQLAGKVAAGSVTDGAMLDVQFAGAHQALAAYYQDVAKTALAADEKEAAGEALAAAANHTEKAAQWSGQDLGESGLGVISLMRKLSGTLVSGAGSVGEGTGDVLGKGLGLITKVGTGIKGTKPAEEKTATEKVVTAPGAVAGGTVEAAGKVSETGAKAVSGVGGAIKKLGDAIKGDAPAEEVAPAPAE